LGYEIEQVERAARCGRQIGGDGGDDASRCTGDHKHRLLVQLQAGLPVCRRFFAQTDGPALTSLVADLNRAGIAQSFLDQEVSDFLRLAIRLEINCLDESIRALALICLGEANDCSTERRNRATLVVAMLPT